MGGGILTKIAMIFLVSIIFLPIIHAQSEGNIKLDVEKVGVPSDIIGNVLLFIALIFILVGAVIILRRQLLKKSLEKPEPQYYGDYNENYYGNNYDKKQEKSIAPEDYIYDTDVEKHLKEEEMIVVRILRQRNNACEQGTLSIVSGFPKATLSRLLSELESRGVVCKTKKGKKNIINLRI